METIVMWALIWVSDGSYTHGNAAAIAQYNSREECAENMKTVDAEVANSVAFHIMFCLPTRVVVSRLH